MIKDKNMIISLNNLRDIGEELTVDHGVDFVNRDHIGQYVDKLRKSIRTQNSKLNGVP